MQYTKRTEYVKHSFWSDRPVFVTGATGFVGGRLVSQLIMTGAQVVCLVRDFVPQSEFLRLDLMRQVNVVHGDVCDQALLERILGEYEIHTVFHLAAQTIVSIANSSPPSTFKSNIEGTWTLLEACRRSPTVKQILIASSDKAYGDQKVLPYSEQASLQGSYPYDVSKACADLIASSYAQTFSLPVVITRCANSFGGGDLNWNRLIPGTIRAVMRGHRPIIRSDGTYVRDYLYVEDAIAAYMLLIEKMADRDDLRGEAFNFSAGIRMTVLDLVQRILQLMNSELEPEICNQVQNEIKEQYLNASKARKLLDWSPRLTLDEGLLKTIAWYKDYFAHEGR